MLELKNTAGPLDRRLYTVDAPDSPSILAAIEKKTDHFALFLAWDASTVSNEVISSLAAGLLERGLAYICVWGPDCERVHDIFDAVELEFVSTRPPNSVVMSTWHSSEPIEEALWFFVYNSHPDRVYENSCPRGIAAIIGNPDWAAQAAKYLGDLKSLNAAVGV